MIRACAPLLLLSLLTFVGCAAAPEWQRDLPTALSSARQERRDLVVYFALPGRDASDAMEARLDDALVVEALAEGNFDAVWADGIKRRRLYKEWISGGEGMGIVVLDGGGVCYAARPGPQDAPELAAFLRKCAASRADIATLQGLLNQSVVAPVDKHALGCLLLELGCRHRSELLLVDAAMANVVDARHRLARLYALDGNVTSARRWLKTAPKTPAALVTEGYVLFKERRHRQAITVFKEALATGNLGDDRQRALLFLAKSLHENRRDDLALPMLEALAAEGTGSTFEAAATHTLGHIKDPDDSHAH